MYLYVYHTSSYPTVRSVEYPTLDWELLFNCQVFCTLMPTPTAAARGDVLELWEAEQKPSDRPVWSAPKLLLWAELAKLMTMTVSARCGMRMEMAMGLAMAMGMEVGMVEGEVHWEWEWEWGTASCSHWLFCALLLPLCFWVASSSCCCCTSTFALTHDRAFHL